MSFKTILLLSLISISLQFFAQDTSVIQLTKDNFENEVIKSDNLWLILFYAPWCGHCKAFHPQYEKLAKSVKGVFKIGAVNCEEHRDLAQKYNIGGFPTVLFFGGDKTKTIEYEGERKAEKIIDFLLEKAKNVFNDKLTEKKEEKTDL